MVNFGKTPLQLQVLITDPVDLVLKLQPLLGKPKPAYTLLGRFLSNEVLNWGAVQAMIQKLWSSGGIVVIHILA